MCWKCHQKLSNEEVLEQLSRPDRDFQKWNGTSLGHVLIAASGHNGEEVKKVAKDVLRNYFTWLWKSGPETPLWPTLAEVTEEVLMKTNILDFVTDEADELKMKSQEEIDAPN